MTDEAAMADMWSSFERIGPGRSPSPQPAQRTSLVAGTSDPATPKALPAPAPLNTSASASHATPLVIGWTSPATPSQPFPTPAPPLAQPSPPRSGHNYFKHDDGAAGWVSDVEIEDSRGETERSERFDSHGSGGSGGGGSYEGDRG